ncbi:kinetochore complex Sim4 subunit Fta1-domain-containing protein [Plectosphaerella plurivora]|uniref:Kinetochore complex Sim4 subunit Fta1-domain-containing protein n=1 Tax=Plectosphaerella plurivora TaxID=936078 RepID=A0A9P8V8M2_9PEZI|nr:kinetochore complex Sim4 subunit Fta1-domain-containing protein [Plectosphaerella plurivora]
MPPKRKRPANAPDAQARSAPSRSSPADVHMQDDAEPPPQFFNASFTAHRVSSLFIGDELLTTTRLATIAQRLRDTLVGDVVRGVQVGLEGADAGLGRAGSLELVTVRWFDAEAMLGDENTNTPRREGLSFEMRYENTLCTALLLPRLVERSRNKNNILDGPFGTDDAFSVPSTFETPRPNGPDDARFLELPLLLTRMPTQLRSFVLDFICRTFDCRVAHLGLGTRSLTTTWERWVQDAGLPTRGPLAKDLVLTIGFHMPSPEEEPSDESAKMGLRIIDVIIPPDDAERFLREDWDGNTTEKQDWEDNARLRSNLSGGGDEEGWAWLRGQDGEEDPELPFTRALAFYLDKHLALNLFHPSVRIVRIACGGFVLAENRVKVFATASGDEELVATGAVKRLVAGLVDRAG